MKNLILLVFALFTAQTLSAQSKARGFREQVPLDSIQLSDPAILADEASKTYYMTGTGGLLWKSKDLKTWTGPYVVAQTDSDSWMGKRPMIWAAELHAYKGKYYYFATFTNRQVFIGTNKDGTKLERRACHVLVSDKPDGPYKPMKDSTYLPAGKLTLDGTLWVDKDRKPYMVYCGEWLQEPGYGTIESIKLKPDLSGSTGKSKLLFTAAASPWSREKINGKVGPNRVTDGPYLFRTGSGRLGMIWTSWIYDVYTQGVAYSTSGTLAGPWVQEEKPVTPQNFGHGMLFKTFDSKWLMSVHSHRSDNGRYIRVPHLFEVDMSGNRLIVKGLYKD